MASALGAKAQKSSYFHRFEGPVFGQTERSLGLMSELSFARSPGLALGVSKGLFGLGEGGGTGQGFSAMYHYEPVTSSHGPSVDAWFNTFAFFFGFSASVQYRWIYQDDEIYRLIKPEIGLGYVKVMVSYGWNRFQNGTPEGWGSGSVQLRYYHTIVPSKEQKGRTLPSFE